MPLLACAVLAAAFVAFAYASVLYSRLCMMRFRATGRQESFANAQMWLAIACLCAGLAGLLVIDVVFIVTVGAA